jgi:ribonuclease HII
MVQAAVALRLPDDGCPWVHLTDVVRRAGDPEDGRIAVDDSKLVYSGKNLTALERGVFALTGGFPPLSTAGELQHEYWLTDSSTLAPSLAETEWGDDRNRVGKALCRSEIKVRWGGIVITFARHFNEITDRFGSKGAVTAAGVQQLLRQLVETVPRGPLEVMVDKQGGRHYYAALLSEAFPDVWPRVVCESPARSEYLLAIKGRDVRVVFAPRADSNHMGVAIASMAAKYLRERLMARFNEFWQTHIPGLVPTAGYPVDAKRFYSAIRPAMQTLGIAAGDVWRNK